MEYEDYLFVPIKRLGTLIGDKGKVKRLIEQTTGVKIKINSDTGEVTLIRKDDNAPKALDANACIKAIAVGFPSKIALQLLKEGFSVKVIDLNDLVKNEKALERQKARLIGKQGTAKKQLEKYTRTKISIYEDMVGILGGFDEVESASEAIVKLCSGTPHGDVYKTLRKRNR